MGIILFEAIRLFSTILTILIFARAILSWFPEPRSEGFRQVYFGFLRLAHALTEPIIGPIRALIQRSPLGGPGMMMDFSPIIAIFAIRTAQILLQSIVISLFLS